MAEILRCASAANSAAVDLMRTAAFGPEQARDVLPHVRRADFETRLQGLAIRGVKVAVRPNSKGTSSFVEVSAPGTRMTSLTRSQPPRKLPAALYRNSRAQAAQTTLYHLLGSVTEEDGNDDLYGVFVYGGTKDGLTIASVYFPIPSAPLRTVPPLNMLHDASLRSARESGVGARPTEEAVSLVLGLKCKVEEEAL